MTDIFGASFDADRVERAVQDTLKTWLPAHLAHQERIQIPPLPNGFLKQPAAWPVLSELVFKTDRLPAIVVVSPGMIGAPVKDRGLYRATWHVDVVVATAGAKEHDARKKAALTLAACRDALIQNTTLGDQVEQCLWTGGDNHAAGNPRDKNLAGQRAVYSTSFAVTVRNVADARSGPDAPPDDPYSPGQAPQSLLIAEIEIESTPAEDTP